MKSASRDPERTRQRILAAATDEFARHGLGGARVDRIAQRAGANKRMLYYYFGDKDRLFLAALEGRYAHIRAAERALDLERVEPREALRSPVAPHFGILIERSRNSLVYAVLTSKGWSRPM